MDVRLRCHGCAMGVVCMCDAFVKYVYRMCFGCVMDVWDV